MTKEQDKPWVESETNPDPHFLESCTRSANSILRLCEKRGSTYRLDELPIAERSQGYLREVPVEWANIVVSQLCDFETRRDETGAPQVGRGLLDEISGVLPEDVITPLTRDHTNNVNVVRDRSDLLYSKERGANSVASENGDPLDQDGVILIRSAETQELVIEIPDADCVKIVGAARLKDGTDVVFGAHCGFRGTQRGIVENLADQLRALEVEPGSVSVLVGYGSQNSVVPIEDLRSAANENPNSITRDHWSNAVGGSFVDIEGDKREQTAYSNQSDVIGRVELCFNDLLNPVDGLSVISTNTVTEPRLRSYRADSALNQRYGGTPSPKSGRNITRISFAK